MKRADKGRILGGIERLEVGEGRLSSRDAEILYLEVLEGLLREDGYQVNRVHRQEEGRVDSLAYRPAKNSERAYKLAIEFKYRSGRAVGVEEVRSLLGGALLHEADRALLVINTRFSPTAKEFVRRELPIELDLIDLESLKSWIDRLEVEDESVAQEVLEIVNAMSRQLALLIGRNPRALDEIEWREMEKLVAFVFEGIGFQVELTPGSKDKGKDVILECLVKGRRQEYIVEIKHWRSRERVGSSDIREFLHVIARENREGGLFLSTYGYTGNAFEQLSEIDRQRLRFGHEEKVVSLCRRYTKARSGIWSPPENLPEVLFEETI